MTVEVLVIDHQDIMTGEDMEGIALIMMVTGSARGVVTTILLDEGNAINVDKSHAKTKSGGIEIGKQLAEKSKGLFAADDWQCKMCGNVNWSRRSECNVCKSPKVGCVESRTGYGGGFNERENVQYNEREDSDGEFDEFGRKKKKYRGKLDDERKERETKNETNKKEKEDEEDEEDDEEDGDSDAYKLTSDEEEEEDENDVSAYDLGDSDEDTNDKKDPNSSAAKSSENSESAGHDGQRKRARSRSRSHEREIKKFAES
ncbi:uncharacterized protein [Antedon mediterranea]|uniref:uncharacterized protein isoform X2 n=1 Tax=Antedon mediterranea TaxID=105859 RepID=UPI003AF9EEAB